ncbi:MAG: LPS export ABC transporter ATP-binding protein [Myxococcota bacterium]|nr:LPS export ABC transporter ATP-binding protein [Myxococcota bacterium]
MPALLEARHLLRHFGERRVVDGVSLSLNAGEVVGLLGPNGAGKTTTFRMIAGLLKPDSGEVWLDGEEVTKLPLHRRAALGLGYLAQRGGLFPGLDVRQNLMVAGEIAGLSSGEAKKRAEGLIERLSLQHVIGGQELSISGGERRRSEIARALMVKPRVLLFDEPFAGVDPLAVSALQSEMRALADSGLAILITDHAVAATLSLCDQVLVLNEGRVLVSGTPAEVEADARVRAAYLGPS